MSSSKIYEIGVDEFPVETDMGRLSLSEDGTEIVLPKQEKDNVVLTDVKVSGPDSDGKYSVEFGWSYKYWLRRDSNTRARYMDCSGSESLDLSAALTALVQKASHSSPGFESGTFTVVSEGQRGRTSCPPEAGLKIACKVIIDTLNVKSTNKTTDGSTVKFTPADVAANWDKLAKAQQAYIAKLAKGGSMF